MPESQLHLGSKDCSYCHGVGFLGMSYPEDPALSSGNFTPPICTWCNNSNATNTKWGNPPAATAPVAPSLASCYSQLNSGVPENWNMVLPLSRSTPAFAFNPLDSHSFPSSPASATDLSPSTYSTDAVKGYFDFIPIQNHYDRSAPISPSALSVPGSDNDPSLDHLPVSPSGGGCSRTQNQRDSKARCLKKLDNAMEKLISTLPSEMQLSCKRGRANGLKLVEEYIMRIIAENNQLRSEDKKKSIDYERVLSEVHQLRDENAQLRRSGQSTQYR